MTGKPILPTFARPLDSGINIDNLQKVAGSVPGTTPSPFGTLPGANFATTLGANGSQANIRDLDQFARTSETYASQVNETVLRDLKGAPNPLNEFANYTYHVRFSMIDSNQAYQIKSGDRLNQKNQIIIAESGATAAYNITRFNTTTLCTPNFRSRNIPYMSWKMTITEPFGLTFPDYVFAAANQLNIRNGNRFPFFVEVWFNGYNEDGTIAAENICYKVWRVMIIDMSLSASHVGSTYEIEGIADNGIGSSNQYSMTPATIKIDGIETFGNAIKKLEDEMNSAAKKAENAKTATEYKIEAPEFMKSWKIVPPTADANSQRQGSMSGQTSAKGGNEIPINKGQDIGNFVTYMLAKCGDEADRWYRGVNATSSTPSFDKNGLGQVIQIYSEVEVGDYNEMLNDYNRKIIFRIVPHVTTRTVSDPEQAKKMQNIAIQAAKVSYLQAHKLLNKRYDYFYTGKNTEVIKFDIQINNFWSISLPAYLGTRSYAQMSHGAVAAPNSAGFRENLGYGQAYKLAESVQAQIKEIDKLINSLTSNSDLKGIIDKATGGQLPGAISNLQNLPNTIQDLSSGQINSLLSQLGGTSSVLNSLSSAAATAAKAQISRLSILNQKPVPQFDTGTRNTLDALQKSIASLVSELSQTSRAVQDTRAGQFRGGKYLEDIKSKVESDDELKVAFLVENRPLGQDGNSNGSEGKQNMNAVAPSGSLPPGANMFGSIMNNLYERNQMMEIDLEIRGDPWWLGLTNIEENDYTKRVYSSGSTTSDADTYANFLNGENVILLSFKTGSNYNEQTGFMTFNSDADTFNGLFAVREVESKFENGSFTQSLKAWKELFSQKISKDMTPKTTPNVPTPQSTGNYDPVSGALVPEGSIMGPIA
jgi:hypothetical protein